MWAISLLEIGQTVTVHLNQIAKQKTLKRNLCSIGDLDKLTFHGATVDINKRLHESECNAADRSFKG